MIKGPTSLCCSQLRTVFIITNLDFTTETTKTKTQSSLLAPPLLELTVPTDLPVTARISINQLVRQAGVSQAMRRRLRTDGIVYINQTLQSWHTLLQPGDHVKLYLPNRETAFSPWDYALPIIYEDEHLLVINKPVGLLMHPTSSERYHTVANALIHYYRETKQTHAAFHPVHRLDKDTSGLVIIAKNALVQHSFSKLPSPIKKTYVALCDGYFPAPLATLRWPIARKTGSIIECCCRPQGKPAHTDVQCLKRSERLSLVRFQLHTGRTHQIRVHMAQLGYPLVGDDLYGGSLDLLQQQALHAIGLQFVHPMTKQRLLLHTPLPQPWEALILQYLRKG